MASGSRKRRRGGNTGSPGIHILLLVLCIVLMVAGKADILLMHSARTVAAGVLLPIVDVVSVPFKATHRFFDNVASIATMQQENLRLKEDVATLKKWRRRAEHLLQENRQLRLVSEIVPPPETRPVSARVVAVNSDSFAHSVMVNTGSNEGIRKGNAVTTADGLVGIVVDTGPRHAQILLITDINAMIPVILTGSSWPAATQGRNSALMHLGFLPRAAEVSVGEAVQTSGHGGVLPAGIHVGRVVQVRGRNAVVKPAADLQRLGFVTILTTEDDPGYEVDDVFSPRITPLPVADADGDADIPGDDETATASTTPETEGEDTN